MGSYKIIITPDAEMDLIEIRNYIALVLRITNIALHSYQNWEAFLYGRQYCPGTRRAIAFPRYTNSSFVTDTAICCPILASLVNDLIGEYYLLNAGL